MPRRKSLLEDRIAIGAMEMAGRAEEKSQSSKCITNRTKEVKTPMSIRKKNGCGLTPLQSSFCEEYIIDLNATAAYKRAGYRGNKTTARINACKLLTNTNIQLRIDQLIEERAQRTQVKSDKVLQEIAACAFANISDFAEWGPDWMKIRSSAEINNKALSAVAKVKVNHLKCGGKVESIELRDKTKYLEMLGRHLGLFNNKSNTQSALIVNYAFPNNDKKKPG